MSISRRDFLGGVTCFAATLWSFRPIGLDVLGSQRKREHDCVLLDLHSRCALRESLQGYQAALIGEHTLIPQASFDSRRRCRMAIVPGFAVMDPVIAEILSDLLEAGTRILLESGAGFLSPAEFGAHQKMLHRYFDIAVDSPADLWPVTSTDETLRTHRRGRHSGKTQGRHEPIPYVNYLWPRETKVRDFSRVIPVSTTSGDVIAKVGALPVAVKRLTPKGTLIFLGSPLGPALRAGDPEARSWLRMVTAL
jgi:hypothetical protein